MPKTERDKRYSLIEAYDLFQEALRLFPSVHSERLRLATRRPSEPRQIGTLSDAV